MEHIFDMAQLNRSKEIENTFFKDHIIKIYNEVDDNPHVHITHNYYDIAFKIMDGSRDPKHDHSVPPRNDNEWAKKFKAWLNEARLVSTDYESDVAAGRSVIGNKEFALGMYLIVNKKIESIARNIWKSTLGIEAPEVMPDVYLLKPNKKADIPTKKGNSKKTFKHQKLNKKMDSAVPYFHDIMPIEYWYNDYGVMESALYVREESEDMDTPRIWYEVNGYIMCFTLNDLEFYGWMGIKPSEAFIRKCRRYLKGLMPALVRGNSTYEQFSYDAYYNENRF
jgi:hypothetical protein